MDKSFYILVVDDNHENLRVVSNFLKEKNYHIALATDGENALQVLRNNPIDLILLDVMMPGKDGLEVCREIKKDKQLAEIPVVFLTAKHAPKDIVKGFKAGGIDYITKPFIRDELLMRVKTHIEHSQSKKKLLETIKTRDKLYSIIAHDIRTPFASIDMLIAELKDGDPNMNVELLINVLPLLEETVQDTMILLDNLLEWTRLQTDSIKIKPQHLALSSIIDDCIKLLKGNAHAKNIDLESQIDTELMAFFDEVTTHTIFRNLISNAIKFTPDQGSITLSAEPEGNYIAITVKDTGKGMTEEVQKKIFEQGAIHTSAGTKKEKGSGLGLRLVKDLVAQNNGLLTVKSEPNVGTQVTVKIPVSKS